MEPRWVNEDPEDRYLGQSGAFDLYAEGLKSSGNMYITLVCDNVYYIWKYLEASNTIIRMDFSNSPLPEGADNAVKVAKARAILKGIKP